MIGTAAQVADQQDSYEYLELLGRVKKALDSAVDVSIPADELRPFKGQPRIHFNEDRIRLLSESIDAGGQTTPGIIRENPAETRYELIDGERRWRAVNRIPETRRPDYKARLIEADDDVVQFLISGISNFNREGHTPIEVMETIDRLIGFKLPMKEVASLLGISEHWGYQMHGLRKLVPAVREMLNPTRAKGEQLPVVAAIHISKIDEGLQLGIAQRVLSKEVTLGRLRGEVVRVAHKAGKPVRVREVSPLKRWESFSNKIEAAARAMSDSEHLIEDGRLDRIIRAHSKETSRTLHNLREAKKAIEKIESAIQRAQQ